ncbi:uncharacterized protein LOC123445540 [Hordeum vulgare subsp. vulgare]|uniref:Predicted protein n=1 Tax=Hordeum vulgare subsp. vulgare TaxID=112509 RepID=F2CZY2_HORVV|nr:uncharacterized protein LOC123445540 [Hordeum vulgare subsp. vulgare]XP_044978466.1 uncharacterized protein LOC123445540 [Hordeum vulgare subsp. vulgare]XP_044978467.1 uncharacterized protein LOC123445540 [Hordeum vulgare subsp. vulgare]BAJ88403.1 predicted protein [Hordeum vulgare subsp. vulgare]
MGGVDGTAENVHEPPPDNMKGGDDACSSLEDLLHPLLTFDELELPPHTCAIYNKRKRIHARELNDALTSFGRSLEGIYCKRMGLMPFEASKAGFGSDKTKYEGPEVTFNLTAAPAAGMCDANGTRPSAQQPNNDDCSHGVQAWLMQSLVTHLRSNRSNQMGLQQLPMQLSLFHLGGSYFISS